MTKLKGGQVISSRRSASNMMHDMITRLVRRFMGFSFVGIASTLVSLLMFYSGVEWLHCGAVKVYVVSYVVTILGSYIANSLFVFHVKLCITECLKYFCIYGSGMVVGAMLLRVLESVLPNIRPSLLGITIMPITIMWNFILVNYIMERFRHNMGGKNDI